MTGHSYGRSKPATSKRGRSGLSITQPSYRIAIPMRYVWNSRSIHHLGDPPALRNVSLRVGPLEIAGSGRLRNLARRVAAVGAPSLVGRRPFTGGSPADGILGSPLCHRVQRRDLQPRRPSAALEPTKR